MTVHINDFIKYIGRKPISGDVIELPHLRDQFALFDADVSLPRYYTIEDVGRASEGFSATWFPHLYRLKLKKITAGQQYADILNQVATDVNGDPNPSGTTLKDLLSTYNQEIAINNSVLSEAEANAKQSGYETRQFYTLAVDEQGKPKLDRTADLTGIDASIATETSDEARAVPVRTGYTGYLVGDGFPVNGYDFGHGISFPEGPQSNDFFLRTDFLPNRLFRFDGVRWIKVEDAVRMNTTNEGVNLQAEGGNNVLLGPWTTTVTYNKDDVVTYGSNQYVAIGTEVNLNKLPTSYSTFWRQVRQTLKTSFINNDKYLYNDAIAIDYIKLPPDVTPVPGNYNYVFVTEINYVVPTYIVFKLDTTEIAFEVTKYPGIITNNSGKVKITLPIINASQQVLSNGLWKLSLCNNRVEQRSSLSKALRYKPEADL